MLLVFSSLRLMLLNSAFSSLSFCHVSSYLPFTWKRSDFVWFPLQKIVIMKVERSMIMPDKNIIFYSPSIKLFLWSLEVSAFDISACEILMSWSISLKNVLCALKLQLSIGTCTWSARETFFLSLINYFFLYSVRKIPINQFIDHLIPSPLSYPFDARRIFNARFLSP